MKKTLICMCCFFAYEISGLESEIQLENDQIRASKIIILPHEEIGFHRDEYPQVVIALKGGTITRLEADGSITDVEFPKGEAVFREADPIDQLHRSINKTCKQIELIAIQLKGQQVLPK